MASVAHLAPIHLGLDVHRDTISVGILAPGREVPVVERIAHDEASIRRLVGRLGDPRRLRACYEAGPTGYELARLLDRMGIGCEVIAPSLIPTAPGDRIKTDTRDCRRLARLHRAGELVAIRIPTPAEEAVRDLCRTRADMVEDLTRARNRLGKFLLRHGRVWRGGSAWTHKHEAWLGASASASQRWGPPTPLPGGGRHPPRSAGCGRGGPGHLVGPPTLRRPGRPAGRLPWGDPPGWAHPGRRGGRLAPVRSSGPVHGVLRPGPKRILQRALGPPRSADQGRQRPPARATGLGRPGPTGIDRRWAARLPAASSGWTQRWSPAHGPRSCACPLGSAPWPPARTPNPSWPPRSPANWPGSCGPRWWPDPTTTTTTTTRLCTIPADRPRR